MGCRGRERRRIRNYRRMERNGEQVDYQDFDDATLYRSRDGVIFGVCRGISKYYGFSVFWVRFMFVGVAFMTGFWPAVGLYIVAALVMKIEPVLPIESEEDEEFYHAYSSSRSMALHRLKRTYEQLDRRLQRLENAVTTREYDWDSRLNS